MHSSHEVIVFGYYKQIRSFAKEMNIHLDNIVMNKIPEIKINDTAFKIFIIDLDDINLAKNIIPHLQAALGFFYLAHNTFQKNRFGLVREKNCFVLDFIPELSMQEHFEIIAEHHRTKNNIDIHFKSKMNFILQMTDQHSIFLQLPREIQQLIAIKYGTV